MKKQEDDDEPESHVLNMMVTDVMTGDLKVMTWVDKYEHTTDNAGTISVLKQDDRPWGIYLDYDESREYLCVDNPNDNAELSAWLRTYFVLHNRRYTPFVFR